MSSRYIVIGAGMQGTAAAFDLASSSKENKIVLADVNLAQAAKSADRVNRLVGADRCSIREIDVLTKESVQAAIRDQDVILSCVPYWMHPGIATTAIENKVNMCDLGGNTEITWQTLKLDDRAKQAGVTIVPDCGLAPGLVNSIGLYLVEQFDRCKSIKLYCGVLPQHPKPPFNYKLTFNVEGLVTEYDYRATVLRSGEITEVDTLCELESLLVEPLGTMEAFTTSGGVSTAPYTLKDRLEDYEYKTIRFPGHCDRMRIFKDFGFWGEEAIDVRGGQVRPKDVFCKVFGDHLRLIEDTDQCAVRAIGHGIKGGREVRLQADLFDRQCEKTGFTSMERLTGFSLSILAQHVAAGQTDKGCVRYENAMTGANFVEQLSRRGINLSLHES